MSWPITIYQTFACKGLTENHEIRCTAGRRTNLVPSLHQSAGLPLSTPPPFRISVCIVAYTLNFPRDSYD
jgi:hypothetical protein